MKKIVGNVCSLLCLISILFTSACNKPRQAISQAPEAVSTSVATAAANTLKITQDTCSATQTYLSVDSVLQLIGEFPSTGEFTSLDRFSLKLLTQSGDCTRGTMFMLETPHQSMAGFGKLGIFWLPQDESRFRELVTMDIGKSWDNTPDVSFAGEYALSEMCSVLCLRKKYNSTDDVTTWRSVLSFYILNDSAGLHEIFSFEERKLVYEEGPDGYTQVNEKQQADVLSEVNEGFRDIRLKLTNRLPETPAESFQTFRYDMSKKRYVEH